MLNFLDTFPYIGLRPFTEEESLYFKGRDEQILQLTALLEANKFLMVTGASGDGKSSLVYAGLLPNARAGFFKAKYPNWVVVDFRPERSPLVNLSKAVSKNLRIGNDESVEIELRRGFTSLVDLYTSSSLFLGFDQGENSPGETSVDDLERNAANLLIVADQFEEFFTNPENYYRNSPSADSQLVINLLLETARTSIEKNLPIYIVCTMRSDYIGQCAAFRGLPEFIGFSQFFVPRLKRNEMIQVVKEPAFLHGDKISNRLVERVVYDLGEGIDQLPVLEHAMNEVWIQARHGQEELDLIHYAMAGGMAADELPDDDRPKFQSWFSALPIMLQDAYHQPGLSQIIDTHANKLFLLASDHCNKSHGKKISSADAQSIIKVAFTCLTKMDEGRAVRNRMTLQEITNILAREEFSCDDVNAVLNIFREQGSTFLRPYITDDPKSVVLSPETVLDITHESLIRNWDMLEAWTKEEFDNLTIYLDFKKQLDRWIKSGKSNGFLLPIGPLTYFENWHAKLAPTKYWVNRYLDPGMHPADRLAKAAHIVSEASEFLKRSASKHLLTRTVVKYGATRIAVVIGSIVIFSLCSFYYFDAREKENERIIQKVLTEGQVIAKDNRAQSFYRAIFVILSEFLSPGSYKATLSQLKSSDRLTLLRAMYVEFNHVAPESNVDLEREVILYHDSLVQAEPLTSMAPGDLIFRLRNLNTIVMDADHYLYLHTDHEVQQALTNSIEALRPILIELLTKDHEAAALDFIAINDGLENLLNHHGIGVEDIQKILASISPFEGEKGQAGFNRYFPKEKSILYGLNENVANNGGYQELAFLYAALGQSDKVRMCVSKLSETNAGYKNFTTGIYNVVSYLADYGHTDAMDEVVAFYCGVEHMTHSDFYEVWLNRSGIMTVHLGQKLFDGSNHNNNLELLSDRTLVILFARYYSWIIKENSNPDELNFRLSLYYKHYGSVVAKLQYDRRTMLAGKVVDSLYRNAVSHYEKTGDDYLGQQVTYYDRTRQKSGRRKDFFLYPDHFQRLYNSRYRAPRYFTTRFLHFLLDNRHFDHFYKDPADLANINTWVLKQNEVNLADNGSRAYLNYTPLTTYDLERIDSILTAHPSAKALNNNLVRLLLIADYISNSNYDRIEKIYAKLDIEKFRDNLRLENAAATNYAIALLTGYLAQAGRRSEVTGIISNYTRRENRVKAYALAAHHIQRNGGANYEDVFLYLDSAISELKRTKQSESDADNTFSSDPRIMLVLALSTEGGMEMNRLALDYLRQVRIVRQVDLMERWMQGMAASGNYYLAYSSIPDLTILGNRLYMYNLIMIAEIMKRPMTAEWKKYFVRRSINFVWEDYGFEADNF